MPTRRPIFLSKLATLAFALTILCLASTDASAQSGGRIHQYFQNFYGQEFYDGQKTGIFHRDCNRQNHRGIYGPAMMYDRQYGDETGYATARPFIPLRATTGTGYGGNYFPNW